MAQTNQTEKSEFPMFKGRPLVRCKDTVYYGNMQDEYVVMMKILETKTEDGMEMASKVLLQMLRTDPAVSPKDMIVKKSEKASLYDAIDVAAIWLDRAMKNPEK